jgi:hypothetical protein
VISGVTLMLLQRFSIEPRAFVNYVGGMHHLSGVLMEHLTWRCTIKLLYQKAEKILLKMPLRYVQTVIGNNTLDKPDVSWTTKKSADAKSCAGELSLIFVEVHLPHFMTCAVFKCKKLFGDRRIVGGLYAMVGRVCIPTLERGNEKKMPVTHNKLCVTGRGFNN